MKRLTFLVVLTFFALGSQAGLTETILIGPVAGGNVSATIEVHSELSVSIKNRSDDSSASSVNFGIVASGTQGKIAPQYLEVSYFCNYGPNPPVWGIDIYTNNTEAITGFAKGGLIHNDSNSVRVVMCYSTYDNLQPGITDPSSPPISNPWIYIVDKSDTDDPDTPDQTDWDTLLQNNYPRILYGFGNSETFLQMDASSCTSPVYIYPAGLFENSAGGNYNTTLHIDLYHL